VQFLTLRARNYSIEEISKFQRHNAQPITPLWEMEVYLKVWCIIRLSDVTVSEVLDSDLSPIIFHILDHVRTKQISKPLEVTD
jgi:hypothetical protein